METRTIFDDGTVRGSLIRIDGGADVEWVKLRGLPRVGRGDDDGGGDEVIVLLAGVLRGDEVIVLIAGVLGGPRR